jgi:hypothetical protein
MKTYVPKPLDTSHVVLPADVLDLREKLAENNHEVWAAQRIAQGWTCGPKRNDAVKEHPCLVPYDDLLEVEKDYDRSTAMETLKLIVALGYRISKD